MKTRFSLTWDKSYTVIAEYSFFPVEIEQMVDE
jgi:hypothetical protein